MGKLSPLTVSVNGFKVTIAGLDKLSVSNFTITGITYDPCLLNNIIVTVKINVGLSTPQLIIVSDILGNFNIMNPHLQVNDLKFLQFELIRLHFNP